MMAAQSGEYAEITKSYSLNRYMVCDTKAVILKMLFTNLKALIFTWRKKRKKQSIILCKCISFLIVFYIYYGQMDSVENKPCTASILIYLTSLNWTLIAVTTKEHM